MIAYAKPRTKKCKVIRERFIYAIPNNLLNFALLEQYAVVHPVRDKTERAVE